MKCKYEGTGIYEGRCWGTKEIDPCPGYDKCSQFKPNFKTNADHIRSMSDEELAEFFILRDAMRRLYIESEVYSCYSQNNLITNSESLTKTTWLNWLKQPYKEDK